MMKKGFAECIRDSNNFPIMQSDILKNQSVEKEFLKKKKIILYKIVENKVL